MGRFKEDCRKLCRCHLKWQHGHKSDVKNGHPVNAESPAGPAGSRVCLSGALNPPHSERGIAGGIEFFTVVTMAVGTCCCSFCES